MEFFTSERISPSTTNIAYLHNVYCYLVEGREYAVLLDASAGFGDLKTYVETLTDKPVRVILTHGHVDHVGCASLFETVYLHEKDWEAIKTYDTADRKTLYTSMILKDRFDESVKKALCPERTRGYLPLYDGQLFDLGGVTLEMIEVPGHTQGAVCVLCREERWILFGDMCSPSVFLWCEESTSVEEYLESLKRLKMFENRYDTVYLSHGNAVADKSILDGVMQVCHEVLEGKDDAICYPFRDFEGLLKAKETDHRWVRSDGGIGNIVYRQDKIHRIGKI